MGSTKVKDKPLFFQITHTDRIRRLSSAADRHLVPSARFTYEFSPLSVRVKRKGKRWYQFLTSLLAILGGTFTTVQACSGAVDSVGSVVKEALGKQNWAGLQPWRMSLLALHMRSSWPGLRCAKQLS